MACQSRVLREDIVYTIGETDYNASGECGASTPKYAIEEKIRMRICESCALKRKKGLGSGWIGWFDWGIPPDAAIIGSRRFYDALLVAYKEEKGDGAGSDIKPVVLRGWFQKILKESEEEEMQEELRVLKERLGEGNKPEDMPFSEFLELVKRKMELEKQLHGL